MKRRPHIRIAVTDVRQGAEAQLRNRRNRKPPGEQDSETTSDTQRLLHELRVYQLELETQNGELQRARDELEASLEKYSDLYEFAPIGYFTLAVEGIIQQVNLTGASLIGIERSRLLGRPFGSLLSPELRPAFKSFLERVFACQATQEGNFDLLRTSNPHRIVNLKAQRTASGSNCRVVLVDMTEQAKAEADTAKLAAIVKSSNDAIISKDLNGVVTSWNAGAERIFGYSASEMVGCPISRLIPPTHLAEQAQIMSQLKRGEGVDHFETLRVTKDGRLVEVSVTVSPIRYASGKVVGASKVARDITDRKRAEEALRESEERLRLSQDVAHVGTFDWDIATGINIWTPNLEAMYGLPPGGFARTEAAWEKLVHADDRAAAIACVNKTLRSGKTVEGEWRVIWPDGSIHWLAGRFRAFKDKFGKPVRLAGVNVDITDRKSAERAERRLFVLAASNRKLQREIVKRQALESSLKQSEQHQKQLVKHSRQLHEQLRQLAREVLEAQEEERTRISRELHDVIAQTLSGINLRLATLRKEAALNTDGLDRSIANTQKLVGKSVDVVHEFARELRPAMLDDLGLIPALHSFIKLFSNRTRIRVQLQAPEAVEHLDIAKRTVLYRVAQESLSNVARHAHASRAEVNIQNLPDRICMKVIDNGKSFDAARVLNAKTRGRLGLLGMRERLEMVGGSFDILSAKGQGTTVIAQVPLGKSRGKLAAVVEAKP